MDELLTALVVLLCGVVTILMEVLLLSIELIGSLFRVIFELLLLKKPSTQCNERIQTRWQKLQEHRSIWGLTIIIFMVIIGMPLLLLNPSPPPSPTPLPAATPSPSSFKEEMIVKGLKILEKKIQERKDAKQPSKE
jgi:hypothetical protein